VKHLLSLQRADGTYPDVGMVDRLPLANVSQSYALKVATSWAKRTQRPVRVQGWTDDTWYHPDAPPQYTTVIEVRP